MKLYLRDSDAFVRISREDAIYQVLSLRREEWWHLKVSIQNLFVQIACVWVFKRKVAS